MKVCKKIYIQLFALKQGKGVCEVCMIVGTHMHYYTV